MENEIISRRGLIVLLVVVTVVIFVGVVWLIARYLPLGLLGIAKPTATTSQLVKGNCTYPVTYWKEHPELFPPQIIIGGTVYQDRELQALLAHDSQDPVEQLKAQLAVAFLNNWSGADQTTVELTIFEAFGWLMQHPAGSTVSEVDSVAGKQFLSELEAYNLGLAGVKPCIASLSISPTSSPTGTTTLEITMTPSPTSTATPTTSVTPTPSEVTQTATATKVLILPTRAATQTTAPPVQYPTDTPLPPTNTPRPANTSTFTPPPLPSPTFTLPPLPTATYTLPPPP